MHQKQNAAESTVLPKILYTIYGLESSGTTYFAQTIAMALNITGDDDEDGTTITSNSTPPTFSESALQTRDKTIHIQHLSLPTGGMEGRPPDITYLYDKRFTHPLPTVNVIYPLGCNPKSPFAGPPRDDWPVPEKCQPLMGDDDTSNNNDGNNDTIMTMTTFPHRVFVNITSHVRWYRQRGVIVYPIMVVRDPSFHFEGILRYHAPNSDAAFVQYHMGREIMLESLQKPTRTTATRQKNEKLHNNDNDNTNPYHDTDDGDMDDAVYPIIVSYETLMTLREPYLFELYHELNIHSKFIPKFHNGNLKYTSTTNQTNNPFFFPKN